MIFISKGVTPPHLSDSNYVISSKFMETKKNASVDLTRKSSYFFSIGLLLSMTLVVGAFEWPQRDSEIINPGDKNEIFIDELIDIPPTKDVPPPTAPLIKNPVLVEVDTKTEEDSIRIDIEGTDIFNQHEFILPTPEPEERAIIETFPEETASPKGGFEAFYKFVSEKIKYPVQARRMGIEGRVFVEFVINKDGSLTDVKAIKGIGAGCDEEAVRIVQSAPSWNPGKQRGKTVRQRYTLPIIFKLG